MNLDCRTEFVGKVQAAKQYKQKYVYSCVTMVYGMSENLKNLGHTVNCESFVQDFKTLGLVDDGFGLEYEVS